MGRLEVLPDALLLTICEKLDARSLSFLDSSCRFLHACVSPYLAQLPALHLLDIALPEKVLRRYMESNTTMVDLALDCGLLQKEDAMLLLKPQLRRLHLKNPLQLSCICVQIAHHCINLRSLSLEFSWPGNLDMTGQYVKEFETLLSSLHFLESLSLQGQGRDLDARVFGTLPRLLGPSIKSLRVLHMEESDAQQLANVKWMVKAVDRVIPSVRIVGCQNLERLSLVVSTISDTLLSVLTGNLACLTELDLEDNPETSPPVDLDLSNWGVQQVVNCKDLKRLSLVRGKPDVWSRGRSESFRRVNDLGFLIMAQSCKNLESIRLGRFSQVTDSGLNSLLESCCRLRSFELIGMKQTSDLTFHDMSASACSLVVVSLPAANQITSEAVAQLACCSHLKFLNLAFCRSVGDRGLKALSYLTKLSILDLSGADVTDFGLFSLSKSNSPLVALSLRSCKRLTHTGICALVQGCLPATLQALDLSNLPAVNDDTVMALIKSRMQIIDLRLRYCSAITDACVAALASMEYKGNCYGGSLKVLDLLNNVAVTSSSLRWFQKPYFPRLQWLGLGRHLQSECAAALLREERGSLQLSFATSSDVAFGYDVLTSKHREHWVEEQRMCGATLFNEHCELCALRA